MPTAIFIADLHLDFREQSRIDNFIHFLDFVAHQQISLYILGDLFNFWAGNSQAKIAALSSLLTAMKKFSKSNDLYFLHGNRDFLFSYYWQKKGGNILQDGAGVNLFDMQALLYHGDVFCTHDSQYLFMRSLLQNRCVYYLSRLFSTSMCIAIGQRMRRMSVKSLRNRGLDSTRPLFDRNYMRKKLAVTSATNLICGHFHQQQIVNLDNHRTLYVLPENSNDILCYLLYQNAKFSFQCFNPCL